MALTNRRPSSGVDVEDTRALVRRAQGGDREAFGELVARFQDMAYGCAYATLGDVHTAEDATVDAFLAAYQDLGKLRKPRAFPGWLRRIVLRQCQRRLRRKRIRSVPLEAAAGVASPEPDPVQLVEAREVRDKVLDAIRELPGPQRMVTTLFYINGYSHKEIAEFLEVPVTTVNNRLHASRQQLKERMLTMVAKELLATKPGPGFRELIEEAIALQKEGKLAEAVSAHQSAVQAAEEKGMEPGALVDGYWRLSASYQGTGKLVECAEGILATVPARPSEGRIADAFWALHYAAQVFSRADRPDSAREVVERMSDLAEKVKGRAGYRGMRAEALALRRRIAFAEEDEAHAEKLLEELHANLAAYEEDLVSACPGLHTVTDTGDKEKREWFQEVGDAYHNLAVRVGFRPGDKVEALRLMRRALDLREHAETHLCLAGLVLAAKGDREAMLSHLKRAEELEPGRARRRLDDVRDLQPVRDDPEVLAIIGE